MFAVIDDQASVHTLINTFVVEKGRQDDVVASLRRFTEQHARSRPGFIATSIHISRDGTRVINYAQWRTVSDLAALLATPAAKDHMAQVAALARSVDPMIYDVVYVSSISHAPL